MRRTSAWRTSGDPEFTGRAPGSDGGPRRKRPAGGEPAGRHGVDGKRQEASLGLSAAIVGGGTATKRGKRQRLAWRETVGMSARAKPRSASSRLAGRFNALAVSRAARRERRAWARRTGCFLRAQPSVGGGRLDVLSSTPGLRALDGPDRRRQERRPALPSSAMSRPLGRRAAFSGTAPGSPGPRRRGPAA